MMKKPTLTTAGIVGTGVGVDAGDGGGDASRLCGLLDRDRDRGRGRDRDREVGCCDLKKWKQEEVPASKGRQAAPRPRS